jgi:hypothetical protein
MKFLKLAVALRYQNSIQRFFSCRDMTRSYTAPKWRLIHILGIVLLALLVVFGKSFPLWYVQGDPQITDPAAQEAFLAWAQVRGYAGLKHISIQDGGLCWSVSEDASVNEHLYRLGACPGEGITTVRVFRPNDIWKAEQAHFQASVGKPSWQELAERLPQQHMWPQEIEVRKVLERDDTVVVALVRPGDRESTNTHRFTKGQDGLWRQYATRDVLHGGWATPEDTLIGFALKNYPEQSIAGDCTQAHKDHDAGKICWTLREETEDYRIYMIGPAFGTGEEVTLERRYLATAAGAPAWAPSPSVWDRFPPI